MKNDRKTLYIVGGVIAAVLLAAVILVIALGGSGRKYEKHYDAAQTAFLQKNYVKAVRELDKAMEQKSTEEAYLLLADVYYAQGNVDQAVQVLYLGYSHVGGQAISDMLDRLKAGQEPGTQPLPPVETEAAAVSVGGQILAPDATSAILADMDLGNGDISPLSALTALEDLTLSGNDISDVSPLSGLTRLTSLQLSDNRISDLTPLSGLTALKTLYLDGNPVTDFSPLEKLGSLRTLSMKNIRIADTQLEALQKALPDCRIYCDEPTASVPELTLGGRSFRADVTELNLGGLEIDDISVLAECTELRELDLRDNHISDLTPLADLTGLERLCLWNNQVEDLSPLLGMHALSYLDLDANRVTDLLPLAQLQKLEELWLNNNALSGIEPLRSLTNLKRLGLKNVGLDDDALDSLAGLTALKELTIEENEGLSQAKFDALQEALPDCKIAHSALSDEPAEDDGSAPAITPDAAYVSIGANAAVNAAGTGSGYAIVWDGTDAASAGIRDGFIAQAKSLGMNVVADLWYKDAESELKEHVYGLRALGADVVFLAAGDDVLSALLREANALSYTPQIIQIY